MIQSIVCDGYSVAFKHIKFSDGCSNLKLMVDKDFKIDTYYSISIDPSTPGDVVLFEILLAWDALSQFTTPSTKRNLILSYLPHARADRRFEVGNAFPLAVFTQTIKGLFDEIFVNDIHSKWFQDNIDCIVEEYHQYGCFLSSSIKVQSGDVLVAPDKGARGKIVRLQQQLDKRIISTFVVEASKKRDKETGRILETTVDTNIPLTGKRCIIVDDLADGGGTFLPLAEKLKELGAGQVDLYVTHGIFAKGLDIFSGVVDNIHCYQIVGNYITQKDLINFNQ